MSSVSPKSVPVRPRVQSTVTGDSLLLEDLILEHIAKGRSGAVCVHGPSGGGKSTALAHLASVLPRGSMATLLDNPAPSDLAELSDHLLVVYAAARPLEVRHLDGWRLAGWGEDEWLEYLMARHPEACGSVMRRMTSARKTEESPENPELAAICLDLMAADPGLMTYRDALRRHLDRKFGFFVRRHARKLSLRYPIGIDLDAIRFAPKASGCLGLIRPRGASSKDLSILKYGRIRLLLAAEEIARLFRRRQTPPGFPSPLSGALIAELGALVARDPKAAAGLRFLLTESKRNQPMAASILFAADPAWAPDRDNVRHLADGVFPGARWSDLRFWEGDLTRANLMGAELADASLQDTSFRGACLMGAELVGAVLTKVNAYETSFVGANLERVQAHGANFNRADLKNVRANLGVFDAALFEGARLTEGVFREARFRNATLFAATVARADFSDADFSSADLSRLDMRHATWTGAVFYETRLEQANLEGVRLPGARFERANLTHALLTGSSMEGAGFRGAILYGAGLGDIDWEKADLRDAILRNVTFHMGSSRSGLVFGERPGEGSRSGFYTDEYFDQSYKSPEEIRVANLRGADLRGAEIDGVDFYLVDLRDAKYTRKQETHLKRSGAILSRNR